MQRITITLDDALLDELDELVSAGRYPNRSKAVRDAARAGMQQVLLETNSAPDCVAALIYVCDVGGRDLAQRLAGHFHAHHDLAVATMHSPLSHESGMEVAILKGPTEDVRQLADAVLAERGVRHGRIVIVPAVMDEGEHRHDSPDARPHSHIRAR